MYKSARWGAFVLALASVSMAHASLMETVNLGSFISDGTSSAPGYTSSFNVSGGYTARSYVLSGTLTDNGVNSYGSEARIALTNPFGGTTTLSLGLPTGSGFGSLDYSVQFGVLDAAAPFDPAGSWGISAYESFDDSGIDAMHSNVKLDIYDDYNPPSATDWGIANDTSSDYATPDSSTMFTGGAVNWVKFTLGSGVNASNGLFLDLDTEGSIQADGSNFDTEIALFNSEGYLLGTNDDGGTDLLSLLSYGSDTGRSPLGNGDTPAGQDGALEAGTYYVAVGQFNSVFGDGFNATTNGANTDATMMVNMRTNVQGVPEPTSMVLLGLGALAALRRRKSK